MNPRRALIHAGMATVLGMVAGTISAQESAASRLEFELRKHQVEQIYGSKLPSTEAQVPKAIYGADNRKEVIALPAGKIKDAAAATCLLTNKSRVAKAGAQYQLTLDDYRFGGVECCGGERFGNQKVGGWCSGFLVGKDIVVTAGHCCENSDTSVQGIAFVFGFAVDAAGNTPSTFTADQVYFGKKMIKHHLTSFGDFAVIQLDRQVTAPGATPLSVASTSLGPSAEIVLIGYPAGLPCKVADRAEIVAHMPGDAWSRTNCDSYAGNSGSCVIDFDGRVVGILVRGKTDYKVKSVGGSLCFESVRYESADAGEIITRPEVFQREIPASQ